MDRVYKVLELVGTSERSYTAAIGSAIKRAGRTLKGLSWSEVVEHGGHIMRNGKLEHQVIVRVSLEVMDVHP
jgi:flavin-binding protein dodecin